MEPFFHPPYHYGSFVLARYNRSRHPSAGFDFGSPAVYEHCQSFKLHSWFSFFLDLTLPRTFDTRFDALIRGAFIRVGFERSINLVTSARSDLELIRKSNARDLQDSIYIFDVTFNISD